MEGAALDIRRVRVDDDAELSEWYAVMTRSAAAELPDIVMDSLAARTGELRRPTDRHYEAWAALRAGRIVGAAQANLPLSDNLDKAYLVLYTDPAEEGRGIGTALLAAVEGAVRAHGRTVMVAQCDYPATDPQHRYLRWAQRRGYSVAHTEIYRICPLPVPDSVLTPLEADARERGSAYRLVQFVDELPEPHTEGMCALASLVAVDAPTGDLDFEAEAFTPELLAARVRRSRTGQHCLWTLALDGEDEVVAYTELFVDDAVPDKATQWGTFVHRSHRGHRLGTAVKVANLRCLQHRFPAVRSIHTGNDETNRPMVAINEALGFRIYAYTPELVKRF